MDEQDPRTMPGLLPPRPRGPLGLFRRFGEGLEDLDRGLQRWLSVRRWERNERLRRELQQLQEDRDRHS